MDDGRARHYAEFYGLAEVAAGDGPLVVVWGNCQAEALRVLLAASPAGSVRSVRIPPVFELTAADLPHVERLLARCDVLVAQPVRDGYGGLGLGSAEVARHLPGDARVIAVPSCFFAGLHPWQVLVRTPESGDPPGVPYHDLRTVLEVATGTRPPVVMDPDGIRTIAAASVDELRRREEAAGTLRVSDLLTPAGADACHVVNHPGNTVLVGLARRIQRAIGVPADAADPGRVLLAELYAPLDAQVVEALGLDASPREAWLRRGEVVPDAEVREAQVPWLREHPGIVDLALARHARTLDLLGWR